MRLSATLAALALFVSPTALAGASGGAKAVVERVEAGATDVYWVDFEAGEIASASLAGDHDTDLDLLVFDEGGNPIASDTTAGDDAYLSWVPARTGAFQIKVVNKGTLFNEYALTTN